MRHKRVVLFAMALCAVVLSIAGAILIAGGRTGAETTAAAVSTYTKQESTEAAKRVPDDVPSEETAGEEAQTAQRVTGSFVQAAANSAGAGSAAGGSSEAPTGTPSTPSVPLEASSPDAGEQAQGAEGLLAPAIELGGKEDQRVFVLADDADYVPDEVLVGVEAGTTTERLSVQLAQAGVESVDASSANWILDDLANLKVRQGTSVEDAVNELLKSGVVRDAQPNYVYTLDEEDASFELLEADTQAPIELGEDEALDASKTEDEAGASDVLELERDAEPVETQESQDSDEASLRQQQDTEADAAQPNDPYFPWQWGLQCINAPSVWQQYGTSLQPVGVAVIDAGIDVYHDDLAEAVAPGSAYNAFRASDGVTDAGLLSDVAAGPVNYDHGTHAAAIIGATRNNGEGVAGVATNARIIPIRCYNYNDGSDGKNASAPISAIVKAYAYAMDKQDEYNIRVISMSLGGKVDALNTNSSLLKVIDEAYNKGIVTVCSAGNRVAGKAEPPFINFPSDYDTCVSVINLKNNGADPKYDKSGSLASIAFANAWDVSRYSGSNYNAEGEVSKDISAPGEVIISAFDKYQMGHVEHTEGYTSILGQKVPYGIKGGTSMSAPHVAGVLALMFGTQDANVSKDAEGAKCMVDSLYSSARKVNDEGLIFDAQTGYGAVDALAAVERVQSAQISGPSFAYVGQQGLLFEVAGEQGWHFSSSDPEVLYVDDTGGTCEARKVGSVDVTATKPGITLVRSVSVVGDVVGQAVMPVDCVATYAVQQPSTLVWEWSSSNEDVATVTNSGVVVTGGTVGKVTLTAKLVLTKDAPEPIARSFEVCVVGPHEGSVTLKKGESAQLGVAGPEGWTFNAADFVWESEDSDVVAVDQAGTVCGMRGATTVVRAYPKDATTGKAADPYLFMSFEVVVTDSLARAGILLDALPNKTYTGSALTPSVVLRDGSHVLVAGSDYTLSYQGNVNVGTARVVITGQGCFAGTTRTASFKITCASLGKASVASIANKPYTGKAYTPAPKVTWNGRTLKANKDYTLAYKNNKKAGKATVVVKGMGNFTGSTSTTFKIVAPSVAYRAHMQTYGWQGWVKNGALSGLSKKNKRLEAIKVKLQSAPCTGSIAYRVYVSGKGWQGWKKDGVTAGTVSKSRAIEAMQVKLTGKMAKLYNVRYRVRYKTTGWTAWMQNGKTAGKTGRTLRVEAVEIKVVPKG